MLLKISLKFKAFFCSFVWSRLISTASRFVKTGFVITAADLMKADLQDRNGQSLWCKGLRFFQLWGVTSWSQLVSFFSLFLKKVLKLLFFSYKSAHFFLFYFFYVYCSLLGTVFPWSFCSKVTKVLSHICRGGARG